MAASSPSVADRTQFSSDLETLQGVWHSIAGRRQARMFVAGHRFTFVLKDVVYMGTFVLDPDADPRRIDMHVEEGPPELRHQTVPCIYHLEDGVLSWCPAQRGSTERLHAFPSVHDREHLSMKFEWISDRPDGRSLLAREVRSGFPPDLYEITEF
jgi:uncharacterized protein (TIGR03067 family)